MLRPVGLASYVAGPQREGHRFGQTRTLLPPVSPNVENASSQVASAAVAPDKEFGRASVQGRRICSPIQAATSPPSAVVAIGKRRPFSGYELSEQCPGIAVQRAVPVPPCLWQVQRPKRPMSVMTFPRNEEVVSPRLTRTRFRVQSASRQGVPRKHTVSRVPGGPCLAPAVKTKSLVDRFVEQLMTPNMILGLPSPAQPAPKHTTLHRRGHSR